MPAPSASAMPPPALPELVPELTGAVWNDGQAQAIVAASSKAEAAAAGDQAQRGAHGFFVNPRRLRRDRQTRRTQHGEAGFRGGGEKQGAWHQLGANLWKSSICS